MKTERFERLCGLRTRVESLTLLTGEGESVRVSLYGGHQCVTVELGRLVADRLRLGDEVQLWIERVAPPGAREGGDDAA